jgi:hypothetical protein
MNRRRRPTLTTLYLIALPLCLLLYAWHVARLPGERVVGGIVTAVLLVVAVVVYEPWGRRY